MFVDLCDFTIRALLVVLGESLDEDEENDEVSRVMGILHEYADPNLIPLEKYENDN